MTQTTHLALPLIDAAQAQKHVTHNEALALLDTLAHLSVSRRNVTVPPGAPNEGDRLLVGPGATGAFAGKDKQIAAFLAGGWTYLQPRAGWRVHVAAEALLLLFNGADWVDLGTSLRELQTLTRLGLGTTADAANPLSAKINAALFTAKGSGEGGNGDLRLALNKEESARTVSQIYQSNYSGRAETGLTGDDDFRIKTSPDGSIWRDSLVVHSQTGAVSFPSGGPTKTLTFRTSGVYTPSPGARLIDVILFGGGGGGGSGARQAPGAAASGGGGGGGGGAARGLFPAQVVGASQLVTIGAGGAGGAAQTSNSTAGASGGAGGISSFGALLRAYGGGAGAGGGLGIGSGGGGGGNHVQSGSNASGATGGSGPANISTGGSAGPASGPVTAPHWASGGGGSLATGGGGSNGGNAFYGASGGGGGGGVSAANVASSGGGGGAFFPGGNDLRGSGGSPSGSIQGLDGFGNYANSAGALTQPGGGAGGGAGGLTTAGNGGAGGFPSGGGGGGGAVQNGGSGGAGGNGGAGYAIIIEYF